VGAERKGRGGGSAARGFPPRPLLAVPVTLYSKEGHGRVSCGFLLITVSNVTAHPPTASIYQLPINFMLFDVALL